MTTSLFDHVKVGDLILKNRIAMAPMTRGRAGNTRVANELMAEYYYQRSSAGLLITEATVVSAQGNGWIGSPGIYTKEMTEGWRQVTQPQTLLRFLISLLRPRMVAFSIGRGNPSHGEIASCRGAW